MRRIVTYAAAVLMVVATGTVYAKGRPATAGPKAKATTMTSARGGAKAKAPKTKGPKMTSTTASTTTTKGASAGRGKTTAPGQMKKNPPQVATTDGTTVTPVTPGPNVPKNPKLQARLQAMLPVGMTLDEAAAGFKNQGQFIAAVHASNKLGVPFQDLKIKMVDEGASLGQAIQVLKPGVDAEVEASAAQVQADQDLQ